MLRQREVLLLTALVGCLGAPLLQAVDAPTPARVSGSIVFFCLGPGAALLPLMIRRTARLELGLVVTVSLSILVVIAEAMLILHTWRPALATYVVAAACVVLVLRHLVGEETVTGGAASRRPDAADWAVAARGLRGTFSQSEVDGWLDLDAASPKPLDEARPEHAPGGDRVRTSAFMGDAGTTPAEHDDSAPFALAAGDYMPRSVRRNIGPPAHILRWVAIGLLIEALALWVLALHNTNLQRLSGLGLLTALPPTYYIALIVLTLGFIVSVSEPVIAPKLLAAYAGALVVVLHGTTAILYPEPRYTWVYKHFGVVDYISVHGSVDRSIDIYHNWPGFFGLNAWFESTSGLASIDYAAWAQVFFGILNIAALIFTVRGMTRNLRLQAMTVWIFVTGNWVAQDYLAPQALTFPLVLVVFGLCLRCAPRSPERQTRLARRLRARMNALAPRLPRTPAQSHTAPPHQLMSPHAAVVVGALCFVAVVVSHQLSPVWLIFGLAWFAFLTGRIPASIVAASVAVEAGWLVYAWPYLGKHFSLFSFDPFPSTRPTGEIPGRPLPGVDVVAGMSKGLTLAIVVLAAAGLVRWWRAGRFDQPTLGFLFAPLLIVPMQSYGGEILFRAYLFALPWLAFFAAIGVSVSPRANPFRRYWRLALTTFSLGTMSLFAYFGLEKINYVTEDDVAIVRWYEQHAPNGSVMAYAAHSVPDRLLADYARLRIVGDSYVPRLSDMTELQRRPVTSRDVPEIIAFLEGSKARDIYVAVTPSMENYARLYGLMPRGSFPALVRVLRTSPAFRLAYRHGPAYLFKLSRREHTAARRTRGAEHVSRGKRSAS